ncbi:MAG: SulP family inorganic anion transporter [Pseudomonadota bacterium]
MQRPHLPSNLPVLAGILPIRLAQVPGEVIAGITLAALAIPEVLGYTQIAGTPLIAGLYTILIPAALYAIFGSSRHLVVGADSATAAILASGLIGLASVGSDQYMALAMALAIMVGLLLFLASAFGLGFMADFLSRPVLVGFLSGVGLQVMLHALTGLTGGRAHHDSIVETILSLPSNLAAANPVVLGIAAATVVALATGKLISARTGLRLPVAMLVVVVAITLSWVYDLARIVPVVGQIPSGLPQIAVPDLHLSLPLVWALLPTAFAMAIVVLAQSAATARAYAARNQETLNETRDLFALGLANLGAGFSGAFVVNGSPTKTAMVSAAGGQTQLSLLVMVGVVVMTLLFLTAPLSHLPLAVLSGVVFLIGVDLIDFRGLADIYKTRRAEFWVALVTVGAVVAFGVEHGIGLAVLLSIISHTRHGYRPKDLILAQDAQGNLHGAPLSAGTQIRPGLIVYRFAHAMYFANSQMMRTEVLGLARSATTPLRWLCIDVSAVDDIDYTAQAALRDLDQALTAQSIRLVFMHNVSEPHERSRTQIVTQFGEKAMFDTLPDLLASFEKTVEPALPTQSGLG